MLFTPYHFGPSLCVALPLLSKLDLPVLVLANVAVDVEPLLVMIFCFSYPLHGLAHSFLGALVVGSVWGAIAYVGKDLMRVMMNVFCLPYQTTLKKAIFSGILGIRFHILFDAPLYLDIRPFYPLEANPFYGLITYRSMSLVCAFLFLPALALYAHLTSRDKKPS
jgi:hypothetical protein